MSENVGMSNKESALRREIAQSSWDVERDLLTAQLAIVHARQGRFDDAQVALSRLREGNRKSPNIRRSIWFHLAEGLLAYFANLGENRSDGIRRALALSDASDTKDLRSISSAWMAQINYSEQNMKELISNLRTALENAASDNHLALARAFLVGAQGMHYGGRLDLARPWYSKAHSHAVLDGDDITIAAVMHNMSWLRVLNLRQSVLLGNENPEAGRHANMGIESTFSFEDMTGDLSWAGLRPILRAQIFALNGKCAEALDVYQDCINDGGTTHRLRSNLLADQAWCFAKIGKDVEADFCVARSLQLLDSDVHIDDRAATHSRIFEIMAMRGNASESDRHLTLSKAAWSEHLLVQQFLIQEIGEIDSLGKYTSQG